jgi:hypothetical protein
MTISSAESHGRESDAPTVTRRLLFHVHTKRSYDSLLSPKHILAFAHRHSIDAVIVADHDTHLGAADCRSLTGNDGPFIPLAAEYKSTAGDIIAAFISHPIASRDPRDIIAETHAQGGLVILPHPMRYSNFADHVYEQCDLIETFNSRTRDADNERAAQIAEQLGKPALAGPDAHLRSELPLALNEYDVPADWDWQRILLSATPRMIGRKTSLRSVYSTQMIKACRRGCPLLLAKSLIRWTATPPRKTVR